MAILAFSYNTVAVGAEGTISQDLGSLVSEVLSPAKMLVKMREFGTKFAKVLTYYIDQQFKTSGRGLDMIRKSMPTVAGASTEKWKPNTASTRYARLKRQGYYQTGVGGKLPMIWSDVSHQMAMASVKATGTGAIVSSNYYTLMYNQDTRPIFVLSEIMALGIAVAGAIFRRSSSKTGGSAKDESGFNEGNDRNFNKSTEAAVDRIAGSPFSFHVGHKRPFGKSLKRDMLDRADSRRQLPYLRLLKALVSKADAKRLRVDMKAYSAAKKKAKLNKGKELQAMRDAREIHYAMKDARRQERGQNLKPRSDAPKGPGAGGKRKGAGRKKGSKNKGSD